MKKKNSCIQTTSTPARGNSQGPYPMFNFSLLETGPLPPQIVSSLTGVELIGIGETVHGSDTFHSGASSLIRSLVEFHQVRVIYIEAPHTAVLEALNGNFDSLYYIWQSKSMKSLFSWIKNYNLNHREQVNIIGFDIRQPSYHFQIIKNSAHLYQNEFETLENGIREITGGTHLNDFKKVTSRQF